MRISAPTVVATTVADVYAKNNKPSLGRMTSGVRSALDKTVGPSGKTEPLTLEEWAELCTYFAAQFYGVRRDAQLNGDFRVAWDTVCRVVYEQEAGLARRLAYYEEFGE